MTPRDEDLEEMWQRAKPTMLERCATVQRAATDGTGTSDAVREAAHKMAGAIGMFGLHEASQLARRMDGLVATGALDDDRAASVASLAAELEAALRDDR